MLILLCNCTYISNYVFSSTSESSPIIVVWMDGQGAPNQHVFCPFNTLIKASDCLCFCNNILCSSSSHTPVLHEIILSLYTYLSSFLFWPYLVYLLSTVNHVYKDYHIVKIQHDKKVFDSTKWGMLTIQYTFNEFLNTFIEISANCYWVTCKLDDTFGPMSFQYWSINPCSPSDLLISQGIRSRGPFYVCCW